MIVVKLIGGLGNQMFQYAAAKALATRHHVDLKVDTSFLETAANGKYTQRGYELGVFKADIQVASRHDCAQFLKRMNNKLTRAVQRFFPFMFKSLHAVESGHGYHPLFRYFSKNTYLNGFWQSEKYFTDIRNQLLADFTLKENLPMTLAPVLEKINATQSIGIHVRRGDYVNLPSANNFHGTCSVDYYKKAVSLIDKGKMSSEIFIFSDDMPWCRENLKFNMPVHFIENNAAHWDMYLMSQCRHNVIANSSFSWWAAWLNQHPGKLVVAPEKWFSDPRSNNHDIIPEAWIKA